MKSKLLTVLTNLTLMLVITCVSLIGYFSGNAAAVIYDNTNLYSNGKEEDGMVGLTFNIYENTPNVIKILDLLDEYEAKATFFIGGSWADDNVDCVREIFKRGHELGSHGYFHKDHSNMSYECIIRIVHGATHKKGTFLCALKFSTSD